MRELLMGVLLGLLCCVLHSSSAAKVDYSAWAKANYTTIEVAKHEPCHLSGPIRRQRKGKRFPIQFDRGGTWLGKPVEIDPKRPGCYVIRSHLKFAKQYNKRLKTVRKISPSQLKAYVEVRLNAAHELPEPCRKASAEQTGVTCGGGVGSCFYCQDCGKLEKKVELAVSYADGREVECSTKLGPGSYPLEARFCPPSEEEIRRANGVQEGFQGPDADKTFDINKKRIHITFLMYIDPEAQELWKEQETALEQSLSTGPYRMPWEPVPKRTMRRMPFERKKYRLAVSCHRLFGTFIVNKAKK